jgi:CBS-domain-containing membrane protein
MKTATQSFVNLTAADVMSRAVVCIPQAMSLQGAARLLSRSGITGAPVVNLEGRCVGVLSSTDFVAWAEKGERAANKTAGCDCDYHSPWQIMDIDALPQDQVYQHMTADPVVVSPKTPITELAQMMVDAHIHRLIVADENGRPTGIVSSTDILAAVAAAAPHRAVMKT